MTMETRKTRACTLDTLDEELKAPYALMHSNMDWTMLNWIS